MTDLSKMEGLPEAETPSAGWSSSPHQCHNCFSRGEIACLADSYGEASYGEARGRQGGSPDEDWFGAEEDLRRRHGVEPEGPPPARNVAPGGASEEDGARHPAGGPARRMRRADAPSNGNPMAPSHRQRGSALLAVNPFGGDTAFVRVEFPDSGSRSVYEECPIEFALAKLESRGLILVTCPHPIGSPTSWREFFDELDRATAQPSVVIAVDIAHREVTNTVLARASNTICLVPASVDSLIRMLTCDQAGPASQI